MGLAVTYGVSGVIEKEREDDKDDSHVRWEGRRLRAMKFKDSHPFAKSANGWGTPAYRIG